jgi:hypothetical protein
LSTTVSAVPPNSETPTGTGTSGGGILVLGTATVDRSAQATEPGVQSTPAKHTVTALDEGDQDFTGVTETNADVLGAQ